MEIQIPTNGCSIFYGSYIDHYYNGVRRRYYINNEKLVLSNTSSYNTMPSGYTCLSQGDITYKPENQVWFPALSLALIVFALSLVYKIIIKRLFP